ncbi:MAG: energy transducer TonB [Acidobacteriaceae bacterium]|nr:energy transducer TonB [Acidobacteriaceae bacterium]
MGFAVLGTGVPAVSIAQQTPNPEAKPSAVSSPATSPDTILDDAAQWIGRALYARCLCTASTLSFDATGQLTTKAHPVDWALAGVQLQRVERKGDQLEFTGLRVAAKFADDRREFDRRPLKPDTVKVLTPLPATPAALNAMLSAAFSNGIDRALQQSLPPFWQHYFIPTLPWTGDDALLGTELVAAGSKAGGEDVPIPKVTKKPSVSFTDEAARDHIRGEVTLLLTTDTQGKPHRIRIVTPIGYGLDAVAVDAAAHTTFAPTVIAGKHVAVQFFLKEGFTIDRPF